MLFEEGGGGGVKLSFRFTISILSLMVLFDSCVFGEMFLLFLFLFELLLLTFDCHFLFDDEDELVVVIFLIILLFELLLSLRWSCVISLCSSL